MTLGDPNAATEPKTESHRGTLGSLKLKVWVGRRSFVTHPVWCQVLRRGVGIMWIYDFGE